MTVLPHLFMCGFQMSGSNTSLFLHCEDSSLTYLLLYVDNIVITELDSSYIQRLEIYLSYEF